MNTFSNKENDNHTKTHIEMSGIIDSSEEELSKHNISSKNIYFQKEFVFGKDQEILGFAIYYPVEGIIEERTGQIIQLKFKFVASFVDINKKNNIELIENVVYKTFITSLPVRYIFEQKKFILNDVDYINKLHVDLYTQIVNLKNELNIEKEFISFYENNNFEDVKINIILNNLNNEKDSNKEEQNINNLNQVLKDSLFEYPGYLNELNGANPWKVFSSHLESPEDGGLVRGQFDGHFDRKALERNIPYGIVNGNGNRQKFKDLIKKGVVKPEDDIYDFVKNILLAKNSFERMEILELYLNKIGKKYDDESFAIDIGNGIKKKQSFFTNTISPLFKKLYQLQQNEV